MNRLVFVRKTKKGYLATFKGVKGKGKTEILAIERAVANEKKRNPNTDTSSENQPISYTTKGRA